VPTVVAVDVGTSAVRAAVVACDGTVTSSARVPRRGPADGRLFDAEALVSDVTTALSTLGHVGTARALAVSAHIGTVPLGSGSAVVAPAGGWSDPRGLERLDGLDPLLAERVRATSRRPALGSSATALAVHLGDHPGLRARVQRLLSPTGLLVHRLTGVAVSDTVNAAYALASDVVARRWDPGLLTDLGVEPSWFPPQAGPTEVVGSITEDAARRTGLPPGLPVVAGGPDGSVGAGLLLGDDTGLVADVAGTTDVLARLVGDPSEAPAGTVLNPALTGTRWTAGGPTGMTGGAVAGWRRLLGAVDDEVLQAVPPGVGGLMVLPSQTGTRFPRWRPRERGAVLGQRPEHGAAELLRAAQEGAAFTVREAVQVLDPGGRAPVVLAGGTARSAAGAQLRADVLGRPTLVSADPDVTLLGAAALALVGSGVVADLGEARACVGPALRAVEPDPHRAQRYDQLYDAWREARDGVAPPEEDR